MILHIFSFISFHLIRRTISLVCKTWNRISEDLSIVRKFPIENFESIRLHECLTFTQLKNVVESYLGLHSRHQNKHVLLADESIRYWLSWTYVANTLSKHQSFLSKISLNSCLIGLDQLYTVARAKVLGERVLIIYFQHFLQCVPRSLVGTISGPARRRSRVRIRAESFCLRFFAFFSISFRLAFFLVIEVLVCFFI